MYSDRETLSIQPAVLIFVLLWWHWSQERADEYQHLTCALFSGVTEITACFPEHSSIMAGTSGVESIHLIERVFSLHSAFQLHMSNQPLVEVLSH